MNLKLEEEIEEIVDHIKLVMSLNKDKINLKEERLLNGTVIMVCESCPCSNLSDQEFHGFFRKINWKRDDFKYLNRIQDRWSLYCAHQFKHTLKPSSIQKIQRKVDSEFIIQSVLNQLFLEMAKAEQFYINKQVELVNQFVKLQIQIFEKL